MEYNKTKFDSNEKLVLHIGFWLIGGSVALFALTVFMLQNYDVSISFLEIVATIGIVLSMIMVITGNVRVIRYFLVIRKADSSANAFKSVIAMGLTLVSFVIYYFILLILVFENL